MAPIEFSLARRGMHEAQPQGSLVRGIWIEWECSKKLQSLPIPLAAIEPAHHWTGTGPALVDVPGTHDGRIDV